MPEPANSLTKGELWRGLLKWLIDNKDDPDLFLAVSDRMPGVQGPSEVHALGTMAGFRLTGLDGDDHHRACALIVCRRFYERGLINLQIGRSQDTALLRAVTVGNFEIAQMLLDHDAGHPLCVIPFLFTREFLFVTP